MLRDEQGREVILGQAPIQGGKGGDGEIWPIINHPQLVFKRYHRPEVLDDRARKVTFMRQNPPRFLQGESHKAIAWPVSAVLENGRFVGFLMINASDCQLLVDFCRPKLSPALARHKTWQRFDRTHKGGATNLLLLSYNLCTALRSLHRTDQYVHGDIKPKNVFVAPNGHIRLIDIDSIQISQGQRVLFPALVSSRTYRPKVFRSDANGKLTDYQLKPTWDSFGFVVTCYELLVGIHPYLASHPQVTDLEEKVMADLFVHGPKRHELATSPAPHRGFTSLPRAIQALFQEGFVRQDVDLTQWQQILRQEIDQRTDSFLAQPKFIFRAEPNPVRKGEQTTLHWKVLNAKSAKIRGIGSVPLEGQWTVKVNRAKTFELIAVWAKGRSVKHLSVGLRKAMILVFAATSPAVGFGENAELEWHLDSDFVSAEIQAPRYQPLSLTQPTGRAQFALQAETTFTLKVLGDDGVTEQAQTTVRTRRQLRSRNPAERQTELRHITREDHGTHQHRNLKKRRR